MNKLNKKVFFADCIDTDTISVKCSLPSYRCPYKFHHYNSNGEWNGNRVVYTNSNCDYNEGKQICIKITEHTKRNTLTLKYIDEEIKYEYNLTEFQKKLTKFRKKMKNKLKSQYLL